MILGRVECFMPDLHTWLVFFSAMSVIPWHSVSGSVFPCWFSVENNALVLGPVCLQPLVESWLMARCQEIADDSLTGGGVSLAALRL